MELQNVVEMGLSGLNYPDFLSVDGLLSLRKSTSFLNLQTQALPSGGESKKKNDLHLFCDIREVSDGGSCLTETESDDGSYDHNIKRVKSDFSASCSLQSSSYDISSVVEMDGIALPPVSPLASEHSERSAPSSSSSAFPTGGFVPGASVSRGKYKCKHCGVFKTNHICPVIANSVLMCSKNTSMDPVMVMVIDSSLVIAEKTISVRKWNSGN